MKKKLFILTIALLLSFMTVLPAVHADAVFEPEPAANVGGLWHVEDGNRAYVYMRYTWGENVYETGSESNTAYPDYDYSDVTWWEYYGEDDLSFPNTGSLDTASISNPDPTVYTTFKIEIVENMLIVAGGSPTVETISFDTGFDVDSITIDLHDWADRENPETNPYDYSYITMTINGIDIISSRMLGDSGFVYNDSGFGVRMYWEKEGTTEEVDPGTIEEGSEPTDVWDVLPITTGSPVNPIGEWGTVKNLDVIDNRISFDIEYLGNEYTILPFIYSGNLDFINKSNDILYYSDPDTGDRLLYFNFGETLNDALLASSSFDTMNEWKGEALWNLSQNEVKVTNKLTVYNYIPEIDEDGNVYSYFYMPNVPIDDLISVSAVLAYRYWDDGFLGIGDSQPGEIQYKTVAAVRGQSTSVNPSWVETAYTAAYITTTLAIAGTIGGLIPGWGWAVAAGTYLVGSYLRAADINEWFAYDVEQIEHVIPDVALSNNINAYIDSVNGTDTFNPDSDKLYKLHLANITGGDYVEIMAELSNVTQVVWETDGEIYVLQDEYIEDVAWGGPGTLEPSDAASGEVTTTTIIVWVVAGVLFLALYTHYNLKKNIFAAILIAGSEVYILYLLGML